MKILKISVLSFLALVVVAVGWLAYQDHERQAYQDSLRRYRAGQRRLEQERMAICEKRRNVPLEPSDSSPLRMDAKERDTWKLFNSPVPVHAYNFPLESAPPAGKFVAEVLIDEAGCVRQVKILQTPNRALDAATVTAFEKWAFLPATLNRRPVRVIETLTFNFPAADPPFFRDIMIDEDGYPESG
jgi:TonB family protein